MFPLDVRAKSPKRDTFGRGMTSGVEGNADFGPLNARAICADVFIKLERDVVTILLRWHALNLLMHTIQP